MVHRTINKKMIVLLLIFFGKIVITFSDQSATKDIQENISEASLSHRLNNEISTFQGIEESETRIRHFIDKWDIKGASIAITKDERLIYAKGFGYADKERNIEVEPKHLFRVASISKLITSIAIMQLNEEGRLNLADQVFGKKGILNDSLYMHFKDSRVKDINVYHLLTHSAGWDKYSGDPVFMPYLISKKMNKELPLSRKDVIEYTLTNKSLDFPPGMKSSYSNFGYTVLGEIIEKITGMDYENYVIAEVLNPLGIYDMHIGNTRFSDKYPNEVKYYSNSRYKYTYSSIDFGEQTLRQYGGNNIQLLGAAGGWLASPTELMKLVVRIDGLENKSDILSRSSIQRMLNIESELKPIGWVSTTHYGVWRRSGTLTGTSALLKRGNDGFSWAVLLNTSNNLGHNFTHQIDYLMTDFIDNAQNWPEYDLFSYSTPAPLYSYTQSYSE